MAARPHLMIVEDDQAISSLMAAYFEASGYAVSVSATGRDFLANFEPRRPDLVLLDLDLPDEDGLVLARHIRQTSDTPFIMVTGRQDIEDRLAGLRVGADDYVVKPFDARELIYRVQAILRRSGQRQPDTAEAVVDGLRVRLDDGIVIGRDGASIALTQGEAMVLKALLRAQGRTLTREQILDARSSLDGPESNRSVDILVSRIRRKLERDPRKPTLLTTVQGVGYRLNR